ncbi:phosphodiesterase [Billgrantia endophytica]|uniref:Phosphodiesterase n=1 Tax=Billgrantia endophytica TaxID=2033802 RepID=A0A2N7TXB9_9GAMM|nr:phosphodiesterase [Halomonas endophytica]PMR72833.1 phosphodiesterase [Halomonas endophytica]
MKIIQITDTHFVPPGRTLYNLDPAASLRRIVADINERHADADLVVITGDLANDGDEDAYRLLLDTLAPLPCEVRLLLGNHDDRGSFRRVFPDASVDSQGFIQSALTTPDGALRLLFLDSHEPETTGGKYCPARLGWLATELAKTPDVPAVIFIHHPPFDAGFAHFKHIGFHDPEPLMEVLRAHPAGIRHLFFGHIHISLSGITECGISYTSGRGASHQFIVEPKNPRPWWSAGTGPNYTVITQRGGGLRAMHVDTLDAQPLAQANECLGP